MRGQTFITAICNEQEYPDIMSIHQCPEYDFQNEQAWIKWAVGWGFSITNQNLPPLTGFYLGRIVPNLDGKSTRDDNKLN